ncbi:CDP-alcohol phosphatidyltransferase family protein [Allohahella marinimesophila]
MAAGLAPQVTPGYPEKLWYIGLCIALYGIAGIILHFTWNRSQASGSRPFGWANRVTLFRTLITVALAGMVPFVTERMLPGEGGAMLWPYTMIGIATVCLLLDGVDGFIARKAQATSDFGARFDMEVDAAFILVLCILLWRTGVAPAWVLIIGLMRYGFVAAAVPLPALKAPLPPSLRRKTICVVQVVSLVICLHPMLEAETAKAILLTALLLLTGSFAKDVWDLLRGQPPVQGSVDH